MTDISEDRYEMYNPSKNRNSRNRNHPRLPVVVHNTMLG